MDYCLDKSEVMNFSELFRFCPVCGSKRFVKHNFKSMHCLDCGFVYYVNPSSAVSVFIQNEKGELLVCERGKEPAKGTFDLPGGFVDNKETAEEAVAREIKEELNVDVTEMKYLFSIPNQYLYSGLTVPTLDMFYECKVKSFDTLQAADDVASCVFLPLEKINTDDFGLKSVKKAIKKFLAEEGVSF